MGIWRHPEQEPHEVLLGNLSFEVFERVDWKTKRMGNRPFNMAGAPINIKDRPVFVHREEAKKYNTPIDDSDRVTYT